jgi:putative transposase
MDCVSCGSAAVTERSELTAQGYRRFRCRACNAQFNERSSGVLNRATLPSDIIAFVVFCRLRYRLTLRDLSEIMLLRGFTVSHECIRQWEAKLLPVMGEALRKRRHGTGRRSGESWYADETYLTVQGRWCYLYRAIDRDGNLIDTMLSATRDMRAAKKVLPLCTVGCWLCAGPGDNGWTQLLPARDPFHVGSRRPSQDERLSEQST